MKRWIASTIVATSCIWPTFVLAENTSPNQYPLQMVADETTMVRKGATTSYPVVTSIPLGQQVTAIDEFTNKSGELWYRVQFGHITGWALAEHFEIQKETNIGKQAVVLQNNVSLRKGASSSYESIQTLRNGQIVQIIDEFKNSLQETYYRVSVSGKKGWVLANQLYIANHLPTTLPSYFSVAQTAQVKRGASNAYQTVATISKGQTITVIDLFVTSQKSLWYRIDTGKIKGWVPEETLKNAIAVAAPTMLAGQQQTKTYQLLINVSVANVRQSPSMSAKVLTQLKKGTALKGTAVSIDSKGAKWYKVVLPNNKTGWVHETVVKVTSSSATSPSNTTSSSTKKTIITNSAVLYATPAFNAAVVERMKKNSQVTVLETINGSLFKWLKVTSPSRKTGWIPEFELNSTSTKYVYTTASSVPLRRGASEAYQTLRTLSLNERLLYLYSYNEWLYVETVSGVRGWIQKAKTSSIAVNSLVQPKVRTSGKDRYIEWTKTNNFSVSYSVLSGNRLKITGTFAYAEMPKFPIAGIQSVEQVNSSVIVTFAPGYTFTIRNYSDRVSIKILETGLKGKKIIIDAGHGGQDTGAIGPTGLKEKDVNLDTALLLKAELEKAGAIVTLTRSTDVFLELSERTAIANNSDYDAFISIHIDSYSRTSTGTTTYYNVSTNFNGPKSKILAQYVQQRLVGQLGRPDRGYKEQEFYVNRKNELPSILVELAFISNPNEEALLKTKAFRQKAAVGIRQGLEDYFDNF
ncbi:SH3 domain-containing protein [Anoxybacteroides tepidamans]|uniref:SH3 domain-containing protein n=1 Tax=Anoxybacteroides tepidamans TaxID=265948 RepID=UPI0004892055|nr:N-acetylmuramoyl-L-alanine amidase [Anoxybacillus tepidamans]